MPDVVCSFNLLACVAAMAACGGGCCRNKEMFFMDFSSVGLRRNLFGGKKKNIVNFNSVVSKLI